MGKETGGTACISQNDLGFWSNLNGLREESWYSEALVEQVSTGELWNFAVYGKVWQRGLQHQIFLDSDSGHVPIMPRSFGSGHFLRSKSSPMCMIRLYHLWFCSVVSEKLIRISLELIGPVWGWFSSYRRTTVYLFIHSPTEDCPSYIHVLPIMNKMAVNIYVLVLCLYKFSTSLGWIPSIVTAGIVW